MGVSTDYLIDIGLNIAGFLAAGLLTAVVYSLISDRKKGFKPPILLGASASSTAKVEQSGFGHESIARDFEFIDLSKTGKKEDMTTQIFRPQGEYKIRDRQEILQQAKKMIARKKDGSNAKLTLPITEGELAFIKQNISNKENKRNQ